MGNFEQLNVRVSNVEIAKAVKYVCSETSELIQPRDSLIRMVYHVVNQFFNGKRFVIAQCPTGSGKTLIGIMVMKTMKYLLSESTNGYIPNGYYLTSNKVLQNQIDTDIERFGINKEFHVLKGSENYPCTPADTEFKKGLKLQDAKYDSLSIEDQSCVNLKDLILRDNPKATFASYKFRKCKNYFGEKLQLKFANCYETCPYKTNRLAASAKDFAVLNYAYFLNVMQLSEKPYSLFSERLVTVADEAHLIPDIVSGIFNYELTQALPFRINKVLSGLFYILPVKGNLYDWNDIVKRCLVFFQSPLSNINSALTYFDNLYVLKELLSTVDKEYAAENYYQNVYCSRIAELQEDLETILSKQEQLIDLRKRPNDIYFESVSMVNSDYGTIYKHVIKDLDESNMVRNNFLNKMNFGLFMSATLGDMDEFATLMGMEKDEYVKLQLPSTFDFSKSPIYLCNYGWLNYNSFDKNIDKVLEKCIAICMKHSTEKGVVHTSTFRVSDLLWEKLQTKPDVISNRFLFYKTAKDKEILIEKFKDSTEPYILVGPSLYEGIDLPDDKCRFQVLIKVPYAQINEYIKKKMNRYPFYYTRNCMEKIVQAIGRSNRHKNDYSTIYLLDSCFDKLIWNIPDNTIQDRIQYP